MSKYSDFSDIRASGRHILWTTRCADGPVPLYELYTDEIPNSRIRRDVQFFITNGNLIPLAIDDSLHLAYNPLMDWLYGVYHVFQQGDREAIEVARRDARAEVSMYQELHDAATSEEYAAQEDIDHGDYVEWYTAEQQVDWAEDALALYDTLDRILAGSAARDARAIPAADAERHLVEAEAAQKR